MCVRVRACVCVPAYPHMCRTLVCSDGDAAEGGGDGGSRVDDAVEPHHVKPRQATLPPSAAAQHIKITSATI